MYEWDPDKARLNLRVHGIDFADVGGVFEDDRAITIEDVNAEEEQRFITVGIDFLGRLLVVIYTYRGDKIRLISARKATRKESKDYAKRI